MEKITTSMMEYICDNLCKYPERLSEDALRDECINCKMEKYACAILKHHDKYKKSTDHRLR
jgi:hypothetical protein